MKTGLFYGTGTEKTTFVANKIRKAFGEDQIDIIPVESAWKRDFEAYDHIIAGTSTWFDGELPTYWDEIIPELVTLDLKIRRSLFSVLEIKRIIRIISPMESAYWRTLSPPVGRL